MGLMRPLYEAGHFLAASDLASEQQYRLQRLRRHRRYSHGHGVVCGLRVVPVGDTSRPWALIVCPGYAIGPWYDEIDAPSATSLDVRDYLWMKPIVPSATAPPPNAYVAIRYREDAVAPVPAGAAVCGCDDSTSAASRIRDAFQISVLWQAPEQLPEPPSICEDAATPCPPCPTRPWVYLARLTLPGDESDPITFGHIDNWSVRRFVHSTALLQAQITACCCGE
jgi:hypothetical protein